MIDPYNPWEEGIRAIGKHPFWGGWIEVEAYKTRSGYCKWRPFRKLDGYRLGVSIDDDRLRMIPIPEGEDPR